MRNVVSSEFHISQKRCREATFRTIAVRLEGGSRRSKSGRCRKLLRERACFSFIVARVELQLRRQSSRHQRSVIVYRMRSNHTNKLNPDHKSKQQNTLYLAIRSNAFASCTAFDVNIAAAAAAPDFAPAAEGFAASNIFQSIHSS